jgi:hypothetical protein
MVGLFTFLTIGTAVCIDLWNLLDIRRGHTMVRLFVQLYACIAYTSLGIVWPSLCGSRVWFDHCACHCLPVVLLDPLCHSYQLGNWRHVHEPGVPRDLEG